MQLPWQDLAAGIGQIVLSIALIPSVLGKEKPAAITSLLNASILLLFATVYVSFGLWFSVAMIIVQIVLWGTLSYQVVRRKRH